MQAVAAGTSASPGPLLLNGVLNEVQRKLFDGGIARLCD